MLGDTGVAVNPDDERYRDLVGKHCVLPLVGRRIPIVADEHVDVEFGTGALKITPGHDPNDFEIGRGTASAEIGVIGPDGRMTEEAGDVRRADRRRGADGGRRGAARRGPAAGRGALRPLRPSLPPLRRADRAADLAAVVLRMDELARPAIEAVEATRCASRPSSWKRVYLDWMENIRHWCISRQLWWGHRIPVWYCEPARRRSSPRRRPSAAAPAAASCASEEDVLDTWFSSALWPFATLGWPDDTPELRAFYPTSFLSTAREILFLWVARMVMIGLEFLGDDSLPRRLRPLGDPGPRRAADDEEPGQRHRPARG